MCHLGKVRAAVARAGAGNGERQLVALSVISILLLGEWGKEPACVQITNPDSGRVARSSIGRICSVEEVLGTHSITWISFELP